MKSFVLDRILISHALHRDLSKLCIVLIICMLIFWLKWPQIKALLLDMSLHLHRIILLSVLCILCSNFQNIVPDIDGYKNLIVACPVIIYLYVVHL